MLKKTHENTALAIHRYWGRSHVVELEKLVSQMCWMCHIIPKNAVTIQVCMFAMVGSHLFRFPKIGVTTTLAHGAIWARWSP